MDDEQPTDEPSSFLSRLFKWADRRARQRRDPLKEMEELIEESSAEGLLNADQQEMLISVLEFRKTVVREVMIPRTEMVSAAVGVVLDELVELMLDNGHSRIPVYENDQDHIVGFVNARDLLPYWGKTGAPVRIGDIMRPVYFVPETMNLEKLLEELRRRKIHLAIAVDEYGGVSGLVTLEDILEEIVGDIQDEYDEVEPRMLETAEGLEVDARCEIELLEEKLDIDLGEEGGYETVGGYVSSILGRIPVSGESFTSDGLKVTVEEADKRRVKKVVVVKLRQIPEENAGDDEPGNGGPPRAI